MHATCRKLGWAYIESSWVHVGRKNVGLQETNASGSPSGDKKAKKKPYGKGHDSRSKEPTKGSSFH